MRRARELILLICSSLAGAACQSSTTTDRPVVTAIVGQTGGQAVSQGGWARLLVPAGAINAEMAFTIQEVDSPGPGAVSAVFEIGPSGTTFRQPATLKLRYDQGALGFTDPFSLRVATYTRGAWVPGASAVDTVGSTVSAQITHLSPWALVVVSETVVVDAGTGVGGSGGEGGSGGAGGSTGAAGGGGAGGGTGGAGGSGGAADAGDPTDAGTDV